MNQSEKVETQRVQAGAVLLEFVLTFGVLFFLLMSVVDLGRIINQHLVLTRITYEGIRFASTLAGLEPGQCERSCQKAMHQQIISRMDGILQRYGHSSPTVQVQTSFDDDTRMIRVELDQPFQAIFPAFSYIDSVRAVSNGRFLFPADT